MIFSKRVQLRELSRQIDALQADLEDEMEENEDLYLALKRSEQEVEDLHVERHAERALVFSLLDHLQGVLVRCP